MFDPGSPGLTRRRRGRCVALALVGALLLAGCEDWFPRGDEPERETPAKPEPDPEPEPDTAPSFAGTVADQTYTAGEAITPLTLPAANGGNGTLSYSLTPTVPGLAFAAATRTLSGTPTSAGTYNLTYQAIDGDTNTAASDAATLTFTITVQEPDPPDTAPAFALTVADQTYTKGEATTPLTLPAANGGNGTLSYSLTPTVPGLAFAAATRTLSGTPSTADTYAMTYRASDADANMAATDAVTLSFTITVQEPPEPACPAHAATRIVGDWDTDFDPNDDWVYSFRVDGTYQINGGDVTINGQPTGSYSYVAATCTLAWGGTVEQFVDWYGPDRFCTRFTADSLFCIITFTRRTGSRPPASASRARPTGRVRLPGA